MMKFASFSSNLGKEILSLNEFYYLNFLFGEIREMRRFVVCLNVV